MFKHSCDDSPCLVRVAQGHSDAINVLSLYLHCAFTVKEWRELYWRLWHGTTIDAFLKAYQDGALLAGGRDQDKSRPVHLCRPDARPIYWSVKTGAYVGRECTKLQGHRWDAPISFVLDCKRMPHAFGHTQ